MATMARKPPLLSSASSGAAQIASSWSRASAGSIAMIGTSRRSSRLSVVTGSFAASSASFSTASGKTCGMPCFSMAIRLKLLGASGSPSTSVTRTPARGPRPVGSAETSWPSSAVPTSEMGEELRTFLSTGASQNLPRPSFSTTPIRPSVRWGSFFIGCARQPLGVSSVRERMRSPTLSAGMPLEPRPRDFSITVRRGGAAPSSGSQFSGTAMGSPSSISATRRTVTLGKPPMRWKALFLPSIRPSSAISFSSFLSAIFSCPFSPKALAISRLPTLVSEVWMKSRTCFCVGRPLG